MSEGARTVEVIPRGGTATDARQDECPWCLRREVERLRESHERQAADDAARMSNDSFRNSDHF